MASYALRRKPAGLTAEWFKFYRETCSGDGLGGACFKNGAIYIDDEESIAQNNKTGITHEMGHAVAFKSNNYQSANFSYSDQGATGDTLCYSPPNYHLKHSREWQSAAVNEGIAHFYAASVWNMKNDPACSNNDECCYYRTDNCENLYDWLHDCVGPYTNKGVEFDWLRFWWDVYEDMNQTVADIFKIWDEANPEDWTQSTVYSSLRTSAIQNGLSENTWDIYAFVNGVDE